MQVDWPKKSEEICGPDYESTFSPKLLTTKEIPASIGAKLLDINRTSIYYKEAQPVNNKPNTNIIMYTTVDALTKVEATFDNDTVWLSIDQMAELFQRDRSVIGKHIRNIFKEGELLKESVWAKFAHTAADGKDYNVDYYNLDVIISVGYRVKSVRGTQFRIWATGILKEYMKKGFAMDDERLKGNGGGSYWKELLDRIRDIRSSEKVLYRQVLDLYATSVDYNPHSEDFMRFFKIVQITLE